MGLGSLHNDRAGRWLVRRSRELRRELGRDLALLVEAVQVPVVEVTPLSGRGHPRRRWSTFRLRLADGRALKATRLNTPEQAEAIETLSRCLDHCGLPRVVARSGPALLAQWVEGHPLTAAKCTRQVVRRCGAMQGRVHSGPVPDGRACQPDDPPEQWLRRLACKLDELVTSRVLERGEARYAVEVAHQYAPRGWRIGVTLGDFCPENIVVQRSGALCVIDNETLSIGPYDYDLGRTWYRWPMTRADRAAYLRGYAAHRSPDEHIAHFPYWAIMAIVDGAVFRRRLRPDTTSIPVNRLRALVHDLERGVAPADAMYRS